MSESAREKRTALGVVRVACTAIEEVDAIDAREATDSTDIA